MIVMVLVLGMNPGMRKIGDGGKSLVGEEIAGIMRITIMEPAVGTQTVLMVIVRVIGARNSKAHLRSKASGKSWSMMNTLAACVLGALTMMMTRWTGSLQ